MKKIKFVDYWHRSRGKNNRASLTEEQALDVIKADRVTEEKGQAMGHWWENDGKPWIVLTRDLEDQQQRRLGLLFAGYLITTGRTRCRSPWALR